LGAKAARGHRLRSGGFPEAKAEEKVDVAIVGGGIAGLSAAWALRRAGIENLVVLELDDQPGGNSQSGKNAISAYPWGAHYVPLVNAESRSVMELFQELKVIEGFDLAGRPRYSELFLCAEPEDRLFRNGRWQEGLIPRVDISQGDAEEIRRFLEAMDGFRKAVGSDGRRAFAIPVDESSRDPQFLQFDGITMSQWLDSQAYKSEALRWYVNYCCRDDYGTPAAKASAWAGIHYFAARNGLAANAETNTVLTWPAGNGWLVDKLREPLRDRLICGQLVHRVAQQGKDWRIDAVDTLDRPRAWNARAVVYAAPRFTAGYVIDPIKSANREMFRDWQYAPWLVANLTLNKTLSGEGAPLAWDNVLYSGTGLGYVVATHQNLQIRSGATVITYYRPLDTKPPAEERRDALQRIFPDWRRMVLADLEVAHPEISEITERLDVWIWGHGMIQPWPGFFWGPKSRNRPFNAPGLHFANSDMSGISIFEEAYQRGVDAAHAVMKDFGIARQV